MRTISGVVTGIVMSLDDPEELGRVQLRFPWMNENEPESNWARIAAPMAGGERGFQFMPEIDDEVLVAFEQGDLRFPFVLGFLWNGQQKVPQADSQKRTLKTVSGHTLEFDDGGETISLLWKGATPSLELAEERISLKLNNSCSLILTASNITIEFNSGTRIFLDSSGVTVKGTQIKLN